jgi:hypothetical protein
MRDIAQMKPTLRMRRHTLEGFVKGWTPLIDEIQLVLFYEGIFGPIIPSTMSQSQATPRVCEKKKLGNESPEVSTF